MTDAATTQLATHAVPIDAGPPLVVGAALTRASGADAARTIVGDGGEAALSTLIGAPSPRDRSRTTTGGAPTSERHRNAGARFAGSLADPAGCPFGSVVCFAVDDSGNPLLFISELAEHTRNLRADGRASLLVTEPRRDGVDPLALGRVTLLGTAQPLPDDEQDATRDVIIARHPSAAGYAGYRDFACWRLSVESVRWVGGFGRMDWVDVAAYRAAVVDPALAGRSGVVAHMNADHADAGVLLCQTALDTDPGVPVAVQSATFDNVDRFGCDYIAITDRGTAFVRLAFDAPARSLADVRAAVVALVRRARAA